MMATGPRLRPWLWFVGLYAAGLAAMAVLAYGLRAGLAALL
jgi:hypothetical protein